MSYFASGSAVNTLLVYATSMLAVAATGPMPFRGRMSMDTPSAKPPAQEARELGRALKTLRERRGMTQDQAAEGMHVTRTAWQNYESGRAIVLRTDMQARLAGALGARREDLMAILRDNQRMGGSHSAVGLEEPGAIYSGPGRQQAIFPTSEGDVIVSYPATLSTKGYAELGEYLALFLKRGGV
jgi:transcriptional regulator with XRE-family HTH domain